MFWTSPHRNNVLFCYKFYPSCLFSPLPLLSIYLVFLYLVNNNNHPHFFNFSCRQSNSPPPIRRQPTWSRSSLVCMKYSVTKSSDYWGWSVLLLLIWRGEVTRVLWPGKMWWEHRGASVCQAGVMHIHLFPTCAHACPSLL